jgi:uncharacterized protein YbjT (DUF2867 family)
MPPIPSLGTPDSCEQPYGALTARQRPRRSTKRDVAAVAVQALRNTEHAGLGYLLTGPQSLTQRDKVHLIGEAIGKELSWQEVPPQQIREALIAQGVPEDVPDRMLGSLADYAKQPGPSSQTVENVLGHSALTFADWAAEHAAAFRNTSGASH